MKYREFTMKHYDYYLNELFNNIIKGHYFNSL